MLTQFSTSQENKLAVSHCFMKYLFQFCKNEAPFDFVTDGMSAEEFKKIYFFNGLEDDNTIKTVRFVIALSVVPM